MIRSVATLALCVCLAGCAAGGSLSGGGDDLAIEPREIGYGLWSGGFYWSGEPGEWSVRMNPNGEYGYRADVVVTGPMSFTGVSESLWSNSDGGSGLNKRVEINGQFVSDTEVVVTALYTFGVGPSGAVVPRQETRTDTYTRTRD